MRRFAAVLAFAMLAACGDSTAPAPTVDGTWTGQTGSQLFTLTLNQSGTSVTGSGTVTNTPTGTRALTVVGSFNAPTLTATLSSGSIQPINLTASVNGKAMTGSLSGSGWNGEAITLNRP